MHRTRATASSSYYYRTCCKGKGDSSPLAYYAGNDKFSIPVHRDAMNRDHIFGKPNGGRGGHGPPTLPAAAVSAAMEYWRQPSGSGSVHPVAASDTEARQKRQLALGLPVQNAAIPVSMLAPHAVATALPHIPPTLPFQAGTGVEAPQQWRQQPVCSFLYWL